MRRVHGSVPPKPDSVILKNARKSSAWLGTGGAGCGDDPVEDAEAGAGGGGGWEGGKSAFPDMSDI
jgi:hypothetical protein